jgi:hypothetical protein
MMNTKEALDVFNNFNAFRENPMGLPPHFPEPRSLNEACEVVRDFLANAIVLTGKDIQTIHDIMMGMNDEYHIVSLSPEEYYNEILKRFNETRK